jgi:membrane-bound lytic murein transglycosylase D
MNRTHLLFPLLLLAAPLHVLAAPAAAVHAAAEEEDPIDEMEAVQALEDRSLLLGEAPSLWEAGGLGPTHPLSRRLAGPLGLQREPWLLRAAGGGRGAAAGGLPFPLEAVAAKYDIPMAYNEAVAEYLDFFQGPGRRWFARWLERERRWAPVFRQILREHGVPEDLVYLAMIESGFSTRAVSSAQAVGPWQFISATGQRYGLRIDFWVDERRDPVKATHAAARFLSWLHGQWDDWYLAWAGYNAGPGRVFRGIRAHEISDFWELAATPGVFHRETRHYVPKLLAAALIAKHPEHFGFNELEPLGPLEWEWVEIPDATDLEVIARCAGVDVEALRELNPELSQWATPPVLPGQAPYQLRLPPRTKETFLASYAEIPASQRFTFRSYRVQKGDTLGHIAQMFKTSSQELIRSNRIRNPRALQIGQTLLIPIPPGALPPKAQGASAPLSRPRPTATGTTASAGTADHHVLRQGETLSDVARRTGASVEDLKRWNRIDDPRRVRAGTRLRVR